MYQGPSKIQIHLETIAIERILMTQSTPEDTRPACPECGTLLLRAVYGLPNRDLANDTTVKLMGCLIDGPMPEWYCAKCDQARN